MDKATVTPPLCPRCGEKHFETQYVPGDEGDEIEPIKVCTSCGLWFDGERWWAELGNEWTMAESGE